MEGSSNCDKHRELCLRPSVTKRHKLVTLTVAHCRMEMLGRIGKAQIKKKLPIRFKVADAQTKTKTSTNGSLRRLTLKAEKKPNFQRIKLYLHKRVCFFLFSLFVSLLYLV